MVGSTTAASNPTGTHPRDDREARDATSSGLKTDGELAADPAEDYVHAVNQIK